MHQFKIVATEYNEKGALTNIKHSYYADIEENAKNRFEELASQYNTYVDEEGEVKKFKAYKVELFVSSYKKIENPADFFAQFEI